MAVDLDALIRWVELFRDRVVADEERLTALDSAIGDADHGANMARGATAVAERLAAAPPATAEAFGTTTGMALVSTVGGASGPLYGTFFLRFGAAAGQVATLDGAAFASALRAGLDGVVARGRAERGDKTMVDALAPAVAAFEAASDDVPAASAAAAAAACEASAATAPLIARKGRASYLGERSAGHVDPGSESTALLFAALEEAVGRGAEEAS